MEMEKEKNEYGRVLSVDVEKCLRCIVECEIFGYGRVSIVLFYFYNKKCVSFMRVGIIRCWICII